MHRKRLVTVLAASCLVGLLSSPAHAIFGFGVHGGKDFVSVDEGFFGPPQFDEAASSLGITGYNASLWAPINLTRKAISNPWMFGGHLYIDAIPVLDIELSADIAFQKYEVVYTSTNMGANVDETADGIFGRLSTYATVRRDLIKFPPLVPIAAFYLGGGLGMHFVTPVAGPEFIVDLYGADDPSSKKPEIEDAIKKEMTLGYHALVGLRVKPPIVPIALRLEGKYTFTGQDEFERPDGFFSAYVGTSLDF